MTNYKRKFIALARIVLDASKIMEHDSTLTDSQVECAFDEAFSEKMKKMYTDDVLVRLNPANIFDGSYKGDD